MAPPGYVALGCVVSKDKAMPPVESVVCVHNSLAAPASLVPLWHDAVCHAWHWAALAITVATLQ
jgi:hypothetical protein